MVLGCKGPARSSFQVLDYQWYACFPLPFGKDHGQYRGASHAGRSSSRSRSPGTWRNPNPLLLFLGQRHPNPPVSTGGVPKGGAIPPMTTIFMMLFPRYK